MGWNVSFSFFLIWYI